MANRVKALVRRYLLRFVDVPSIEEFDAKDQKLINDWLTMSLGHKGFHLYVKARDRAFAQSMLSMPIAKESERRSFYEFAGARMENARLLQRAKALSEKQ